MNEPTYLVSINFRVKPGEYADINPDNMEDVGALVQSILLGEADMPAEHTIKMYREVEA